MDAVVLEGRIDPELSRWQWLVKWLLAIPHFIVLVFLWIAFFLLTLIAFFSILFTGRYPSGIFRFNLGVIRWTWRVAFYATNVIATDRYPPFTLEDVDYPARLDITEPVELSRGLVLVKWWLLAIPHYIILAALLGSSWQASQSSNGEVYFWSGGVAAACVLVVAVALLFTGRYLVGLFDLLMGVHRWGLRVFAYVALMTDEYPPFRLDLGGADPRGSGGSTPDDAQPAE